MSSVPQKTMVNALSGLNDIPGKKRETGAIVSLAKKRIPLVCDVWVIPAKVL